MWRHFCYAHISQAKTPTRTSYGSFYQNGGPGAGGYLSSVFNAPTATTFVDFTGTTVIAFGGGGTLYPNNGLGKVRIDGQTGR